MSVDFFDDFAVVGLRAPKKLPIAVCRDPVGPN